MSIKFSEERMVVVGANEAEGVLGGQTESSGSEEELSPRPTLAAPPPSPILDDVPLEDTRNDGQAHNPIHTRQPGLATPGAPPMRPGQGILLSETLSVSTYPTAVRYAMEIAEACDMSGLEKKALTLELVKALVQDNLDDPQRHVTTALDNGAIGDLIDNLAIAAKGKTAIRRRRRAKHRA